MISAAQVTKTQYWLNRFRQSYEASTPLRLHSREVDGNGAPQWSPEWRRILTADGRLDDTSDQVRLRRAMKRIRERSLREYEVLHRALIAGDTIEEITDWLNERAIRRGHPERYTVAATVVIVFAATHKLCEWY